ncbi:hypothetical protein AB0C14_38380 [Microbispora hainanensis]|uniref:hypothetical protein n=1 Tax=Microbispora hainanensis TaxID=568844 RepID=UPI0033E7EB32
MPATVTNPPNGPSLDQVVGRGEAATAMDGSRMLRAFDTALPNGGFGVADLPAGPVGKGSVYNVKALDIFNQVWLGQLSPQDAAQKITTEADAAIK